MSAAIHEAEVLARFDMLHDRFKDRLDPEDYRLRGVLDYIGPVEGLRVLDVGSGKGRFSRALEALGALVVGIDISRGMLNEGRGLDRVQGSARRLPFRSRSFDCVLSVEMFEHLPTSTIDATIREFRRVLVPQGILAIVDKNAGSLNDRRPWLPNLFVKWLDERRGLWMYPSGGPVRERWFWPGGFRRRIRRWFDDVRVVHLLSPVESPRWIFRGFPHTRRMILWGARALGGLQHDA
jgi:2-polyprenyl-6-hydroxyphenyl methylase/3-demethylubiquinone-9 3-methyltransferase